MDKAVNQFKSCEGLLSSLQKKYGKGIIMSLGEGTIEKVATLPTGSYELDQALGIGGLPWGRVVEVYGLESSGKTTLALHAIAEAQLSGHRALFIDAEHAFDRSYAAKLGIKIGELLVSQPDYGEQALDIAELAICSKEVKVIVIDSVSALIPEAELKSSIGSPVVGAQARMMSQAMRKLASKVHKANALCIFINQVRHKIGISFGSPEVTSGGHALKFYASVRLKVAKGGAIKNQEQQLIGHHMKVKVVKNKMAPPFEEAAIELWYGQGIPRLNQLLVKALALGVIKQAKSWYAYEGKQLGQGRESILQLLKENKVLQSAIAKKVKELKK